MVPSLSFTGLLLLATVATNALNSATSPDPTERSIVRRDWYSTLLNTLLNSTSGTALTPTQQNGVSTWGTLAARILPTCRTDGGTKLVSGWPWGTITTSNTNPYYGQPNTQVTRSYNLKIAPCDIKPDGIVTKGALCINGQSPGPLIEANYGDMLSITVTNGLTAEGTSMHWHGFLQTETCAQDGVPGVTQCPIPPGGSITYLFKATLYGSTWYHTHYSAQYAGGAVGPMVIYGPWNGGYDTDVGPVMLHEWYRKDYATYVRGLMNPIAKGGPQLALANSNLINGKMRFPCSKAGGLTCATADYSKFNFTSGKAHRLRLMNVGVGAIQKFAIDGHKMQVIANDFMPIQPYTTDRVTLGVGQRADVIVLGSGKAGEKYWMRSNIVGCSLNDGQLTEALGVIYYQGSDYTSLPTAGPNQGPAATTDFSACGNDALTQTVPQYPLAVASNPLTRSFDIKLQSNGTHMLLFAGNYSFMANFNAPILGNALQSLGGGIMDNRRNLWNTGDAKAVRAILYNYDPAPHPIHLHGHNAQILNVGMGKWDGTVVRPNNPARRDVFIMPPGSDSTPSYLVLQWGQDNAGVWPLHCHFGWHSSMGLVTNIIENPSTVLSWGANVRNMMYPNCMAWFDFTGKIGDITANIDSGLKARNVDNASIASLEKDSNDPGSIWEMDSGHTNEYVQRDHADSGLEVYGSGPGATGAGHTGGGIKAGKNGS